MNTDIDQIKKVNTKVVIDALQNRDPWGKDAQQIS